MDAMCFVLGIRAKHLRSNEMKDLIYKSSGKQSGNLRTTVSLVYEVDEKEVEGMEAGEELYFTRIVNPSGVGSYKFNKKEATFEEYDAHLRGIGIIGKARNFLVFQGDVVSVAGKSPKDLTILFEQISGSDELKEEYDRLKALSTSAEENTIFGYRKRKGVAAERKQIKEQKQEAERFLEKERELDDVRQEHYLFQLFHIDAEMTAHDDELVVIGEEKKDFQEHEKVIDEKQKQKKREFAKQQRKCSTLHSKLTEEQRELEAAAPDGIKTREQIKHCKSRVKTDKEQQVKLAKTETKNSKDLSVIEKDIAQLQRLDEEIESSGAGEEIPPEQLEQYKKIKEKVRMQTVRPKGDLDLVLRQQQADQEKLEQLVSKVNDLDETKEKLEEQQHEYAERQKTMESATKSTREAIRVEEAELKAAKKMHTSHEARRQELGKELDDVQQVLREAKHNRRTDRHEEKMKEAVESMKRLFSGVKGPLVELARPKQRKYNMAMTVASGKHMESIVVDTMQTAKECIQYMRESRIGTANFIPLDSIRPKPIIERLKSLGPGTRMLIDCIDCDANIKPALVYAISNTVLCDDLDIARDLCFKRNEKVKAVTMKVQ